MTLAKSLNVFKHHLPHLRDNPSVFPPVRPRAVVRINLDKAQEGRRGHLEAGEWQRNEALGT